MWPFDETIRKAGRSWSTQIDLMDRYPDYTFICSQAQQFEWVKDNYPKLWERIREKVSVGQFNPIGGVSNLKSEWCSSLALVGFKFAQWNNSI